MAKKKHDDEALEPLEGGTLQAVSAAQDEVKAAAIAKPADPTRDELVAMAQGFMGKADECLSALEKHHDRFAKARAKLAEAAGSIR